MSLETATYSVLLLPSRTVTARGLSLREAEVWVRTYNSLIEGQPATAVIAEEIASEPHVRLPAA